MRGQWDIRGVNEAIYIIIIIAAVYQTLPGAALGAMALSKASAERLCSSTDDSAMSALSSTRGRRLRRLWTGYEGMAPVEEKEGGREELGKEGRRVSAREGRATRESDGLLCWGYTLSLTILPVVTSAMVNSCSCSRAMGHPLQSSRLYPVATRALCSGGSCRAISRCSRASESPTSQNMNPSGTGGVPSAMSPRRGWERDRRMDTEWVWLWNTYKQ